MQQNKRTKELDKRLYNLYENRQFYDTLLKYSKCDKSKLRERIQQIDYCINAVERELHKERVSLARE